MPFPRYTAILVIILREKTDMDFEQFRDMILELTDRVGSVEKDDKLDALGIRSFDMMLLIATLEERGMQVDYSLFKKDMTVQDFINSVSART